MQNKTLWGIVIAIIAIGAIWFFLVREDTVAPPADVGGNQAVNQPVDSNDETGGAASALAATITYTNDGFSPSTVTVRKGQTVQWVNKSDSDVWPASGSHPTHAVYPQKSSSDCLGSSFDACAAIAADASWDFTFSQIGTWKYHNHMNSSEAGTVIVTE